MRLAEFHAYDPHDNSLEYMADVVNYTRDVMEAAEEQANERDDREEMLECIEAVRDRLEQYVVRMQSPSKPIDGSRPDFEPADYAEAGFMLAGAVYELVRYFYLDDAILAYRKRKEDGSKGGRASGKAKRQQSREQYAPVEQQIRSYLDRNPIASTAQIFKSFKEHPEKYGLNRCETPGKTKFYELVKKCRPSAN
tara:strand:- start:8256 stop:8840 length:585 start_codon:yes stop_codon:yes gene_type:complete